MAVSTITITSGASTLIPTVEPVVLTLGTVGPQGVAGAGVPAGGTVNQILAKTGAANYATGWIDNYTTDVRIAAKNDSGTTLAKGTVVYVSGANGTNVLIKPAIATSDATSATTIGLTLQQMIPNNTNWVITQGTLSGINTSAATAGDPVWLSGTVAGGLVFGFANEPQAPTHLVYLGTVTRAHATLGSIEVKINNGWELNELHNVKITSPTNGQVLTYDSANSLWVNSSETGDISAVNVTAPITGGGTSGAVTIGIDQTALAIAPSQVTGTAVITTDPRLSDARTPTAHAASHASAGSDPVTLAQSQVTNLTSDLAGKTPTTRTISTTAPLAGGGDLSANRTLTIADATTSVKGAVQLTDSVTSTSTTTAATPNSVKAAVDNSNLDKMPTGRWYANTNRDATGGSQTNTNGQFRATPIVVPVSRTINAVAIRIGGTGTGSTGAVVRLGIYAAGSDNYPTTLVADWGTVDATQPTGTVLNITGLSTVLNPGIYWIGGAVQGTPTTLPYLVTNLINTPYLAFGTRGATATSAVATDFDSNYVPAMSAVTGALPANWTGTATTTSTPIRVLWRM